MRKLLVVVDYQNDFVNGALGFEGAEKIDAGIAARMREYFDAGDYVLVTFDTHGENYLETREGKALPVPHCIRGTVGHDLFGETGKVFCELRGKSIERVHMVNKATFGVTPWTLVSLMEHMPQFDEIEFVGLVTNMCVISNVACFQAAYPLAQMVVDGTLVDSFNKELHQKALDVLAGMQVKVK